MSGSRSHTATISQPPILRICEAVAAAIFPHPTMATLSTLSLPAARKIAAQPLLHGNLGRPSQLCFQLLVAVASLFPFRVPSPAVEHRRQLPLGPGGILLPQLA